MRDKKGRPRSGLEGVGACRSRLEDRRNFKSIPKIEHAANHEPLVFVEDGGSRIGLGANWFRKSMRAPVPG